MHEPDVSLYIPVKFAELIYHIYHMLAVMTHAHIPTAQIIHPAHVQSNLRPSMLHSLTCGSHTR